MTDTFSANSLKVLDISKEDFEKKYIKSAELLPPDNKFEAGNKFHGLICYYLKGFEIQKFEQGLSEKELELWLDIKNSEIINFAKNSEEKFIEQPFFVNLENTKFYLTGRFDAVVRNKNKFSILDWKIKSLPKNKNSNLQTAVYLYCASILFKTENLEMVYYSLTQKNKEIALFSDEHKKRIEEVILKYQNIRG